MRVLWLAPFPADINHHPSPWIESLANKLVSSNSIQKLTILSFSRDIDTKEKSVFNSGYEVIFLKSPSAKRDFILLYSERIRLMRKWLKVNYVNYDLIHIHGTEQQYHVAALKLNIPKIISIQGLLYKYIKVIPDFFSIRRAEWSLKAFCERLYLPYFKNFSCRTHWDSQCVLDLNPKAKVFIAWEIIRSLFFIEEKLDYFENKNLLFMGGINDIKGIKETLVAFNQLVEEFDFNLIIVGRGTANEYERLLKKLRLNNIKVNKNIEVHGSIAAEEIVQVMKKSFCLIHPSYIDNSPNSICESQVMGLPVVASDVGGVSSLIENGITGLLIRNTPKEIIKSVRLLKDNKFLFNEISTNSRQVARVRHDPNIILQDVVKSYKLIQN